MLRLYPGEWANPSLLVAGRGHQQRRRCGTMDKPWDGVVARLFHLYAQKKLQQTTMWTGCDNTAQGILNDIQTRSL